MEAGIDEVRVKLSQTSHETQFGRDALKAGLTPGCNHQTGLKPVTCWTSHSSTLVWR